MKKLIDTYQLFEKNYNTHDNGGRAYSILKDKGRTTIFKFDEFIPDVDKIFTGEDDSSVLLKIKDKEYIFVGTEKYKFSSDEKIIDFKSPIGNSDVPYPFAISDNFVYIFLDKVAINKKEFPEDQDWEDVYTYYYANIKNLKTNKLK